MLHYHAFCNTKNPNLERFELSTTQSLIAESLNFKSFNFFLFLLGRMPVGVLHCCQDAVVMQAVERIWSVPGKNSGTKSYIPFTYYWILLMNMLKQVYMMFFIIIVIIIISFAYYYVWNWHLVLCRFCNLSPVHYHLQLFIVFLVTHRFNQQSVPVCNVSFSHFNDSE